MTDTEIKSLVLRELRNIAPEADLEQLDGAADLREQIDLDSMDILNLAVAVHEAMGVDIPETDYPKMATLDGAVTYLRGRMKPE